MHMHGGIIMAEVKLPSYLSSVSGSIGDITFFTCYDREYIHRRVTPSNPNTEAQVRIRRSFAGAVRSWQSLPDDEKLKYNKKARRLPMSGYNLYIQKYMNEKVLSASLPEVRSIFTAYSRHTAAIQLQYTSVPVPLSFQYGSFSPPVQAFQVGISA